MVWHRSLTAKQCRFESYFPNLIYSCSPIGRGSKFKPCLLWVRVPLGVSSTSPCSPIGRGGGFRNRLLLVRVQPGVCYLNKIDMNMVSEVEVVETLVCEASLERVQLPSDTL
jgi:hypothetical protein